MTSIHSVYQGRTRRLACRWPRLTLAAVAFAAVLWGAVLAVNAVVSAS